MPLRLLFGFVCHLSRGVIFVLTLSQAVNQSSPPASLPARPGLARVLAATVRPPGAENLLSATTRLYPFALLSACEQAVELLGFGRFGPNRDFRVSSPHPRLADVAGSILLVGDRAMARRGFGVSRSGVAGGEGSELPARRVQVRTGPPANPGFFWRLTRMGIIFSVGLNDIIWPCRFLCVDVSTSRLCARASEGVLCLRLAERMVP